MASYKELLAQKQALEQQISEAMNAEKTSAIERVRALVSEFGLSANEVFAQAVKRGRRAGGKVAAKYRDPQTGATWTGRGKAPRWIADKDRDQFVIA